MAVFAPGLMARSVSASVSFIASMTLQAPHAPVQSVTVSITSEAVVQAVRTLMCFYRQSGCAGSPPHSKGPMNTRLPTRHPA